jgi:hypothetical protein
MICEKGHEERERAMCCVRKMGMNHLVGPTTNASLNMQNC